MLGPLSRILARYAIGIGVTYGVLTGGAADAYLGDTALVIGAVLAAIVEGSYALARKFGWAT